MVLSRVGQPLLLPGRGSWLVRAAGPRVVQAALRGEAVQAVRSVPRQPFSRLAVFYGALTAALIAAARTLAPVLLSDPLHVACYRCRRSKGLRGACPLAYAY